MASPNSPLGPVGPPAPVPSPPFNREHVVPASFWLRDGMGSSVEPGLSKKVPSFHESGPRPEEVIAHEHVLPAVLRTSFHDQLTEGFLLADSGLHEPFSAVDLQAEMLAVQQRQRLHEKVLLASDHAFGLGPPLVRPFTRDVQAMMPAPIRPARPLPTYSLDEQLARGLEPLGKQFLRQGLELGMMDTDRTPEAVLLKDPEAVNRCQAMVLEQLARLGPLDKRELVRLTGLPEDLVEVLVDVPNTILKGKEDCEQATLRTTHAAVLHQGKDGRLRLSSPEQQRALRQEALDELSGHLQKAREALGQCRAHPGEENAAAVVSALHPVHGYEQLTHRLLGSDLAFPKGSVELFERHLEQEFGGLARLQLADLFSPDTSRLTGALQDALRSPCEPGDPLEPLKLAMEKEFRQAEGFHDPRIPTADRIAQERAAREAELTTPESWARYLQAEFRLPHKILERLVSVPQPDQVAALLPLPDLSPEVAGPVRAYLQATVAGDVAGRESAVRELIRLGPAGLLGKSELDGVLEPNVKVGRTSASCGGGGKPLADNPHWVGMTRDAESVRRLLDLTRDAQLHATPLSRVGTSVPFPNDLLLEDILVARVTGQHERLEQLEQEALELVARAEAGRYAHSWAEDPLGKDFLSSPIPAATGFGFGTIDRARKLGLEATRALTWARLNQRPLPLSPEDCAQALEARISFADTQPVDCEGIDYARLGQLAHQGIGQLPPEQLNELLGVSGDSMRLRIEALRSAPPAWLEALTGKVGEQGLTQALWRLFERLPEEQPRPEQGETFTRLINLHDGDSKLAGQDFARVEQRVAEGEDRNAVLQELFGQASGVVPTSTGGIARLEPGLAIGGTLIRTRRRS